MRGVVAGLLIAFYVAGALCTVSLVDKPRKPITSGAAAFVVFMNGLVTWAVYWLWASA